MSHKTSERGQVGDIRSPPGVGPGRLGCGTCPSPAGNREVERGRRPRARCLV